MKRNFKVKFHNIDLPQMTYLVEADNHAEVYIRFSGILRNRGFVSSRAYWRPYVEQRRGSIAGATRGKSLNMTIRTFYFMSKEVKKTRSKFNYLFNREYRSEVAMEVIKLY